MSLDPRKSPTASPCRGVCTATSQGDAVCRGCGRTQEEVRDWNTYSDAQKIAIKARLARAQNEEDA